MVDLKTLANKIIVEHSDLLTEATGLKLTEQMTQSVGHSHTDKLLNQRHNNQRNQGWVKE
jgi:hypothetical protein